MTKETTPRFTNRLADTTSPYLLQHAHNPVDWYPWGEGALARAREEDKPILVSIGYSTCHWCHVMERESFEDEAVARYMNDHFVCIKVDREERPDVDQVYMETVQAISGGGGWPLNAFLLPDARPFYAGTYYPPERKYNRPSWLELLEHLAKSFAEDRATLEEQATKLVDNIAGGGERMLGLPSRDTDFMETLRERYDRGNGGFGGAPKFPMSQSLELLLDSGILSGNNNDLHLAAHGALALLDGGIYDHLGGGFSRYTVDAAWRVPHFEKMLYDNALLLRLLAKLHLRLPNQRFLDAITETTGWLQREMKLADGGYRAALDADSEGVEGKFYVWDLAEITALLPPGDLPLIHAYYGLTTGGNWEEEATNILYRPTDLNAAAAAAELPPDVAAAKIKAANKILFDYRRHRIPPGADDKFILQWNALLVTAWCWCYRATEEERFLELASGLWDDLRRELNVGGQLYRNKTDGRLGVPAFLDDHASLLEAGLELFEIRQDHDLLPELLALTDRTIATFGAENNLFNLRTAADNELPVTTQDLFDNALPSGNSQMVHNLLRLGRLSGREDFTVRAERMLGGMSGAVERYPTSFANWARAWLTESRGRQEIVVTGPGARHAARPFLSDYRPGRLILATETPREDVPLLSGRYASELRYFVCENQSCQLPVTSLEAARQNLN